MNKTYFWCEITNSESPRVCHSFVAGSLFQAKLKCQRLARSPGHNLLLLGDKIDESCELLTVLAARDPKVGWREYVGGDSPYAF